MLEFATLAQQRGGLDRYAQVSTAYVAGTHTGRFTEDDLDVGQGFRNTYEQSKFESEQLVRAEADRPALDHPAPEHRRRRPLERLDVGLQRHVLAAARALDGALPGGPGDAGVAA